MGEKLEDVKRGWREVWPFLLWVLACLAVVGGIWALIYVPRMQVPVCPPDQTGLPPKVCFDIENEARKTLAYILGGVLAIIGITLAHRRIRAVERQVEIGQEQLQVAQDGQITERFTRAIEQLGSDKMAIRLGGIYALERISNDSDKDYWPIMETLTAFVRERAAWREPLPETPAPVAPKPATDIQAILTVLGRRKYRYGQGENQRLGLRGTDLKWTTLWEAHLEGAYLREAHLEGAFLWRAHMEGAVLREAHLDRANIREAHLERAYLDGAHLMGSNLRGAHLENADLEGAHLKGADLEGAHLEGTNFWGATGLTREQLAEAILDDKTRLPDHLQDAVPRGQGTGGE